MHLAAIPKILLVSPPGGGKSSLVPTLPYYGTPEEEEELEGLSEEEYELKIGRYICSFLLDPQGVQAYAHGLKRMKIIRVSSSDSMRVPIIHSKPLPGQQQPKMSLGFDQYQRFASKLTAMIQTRQIFGYKWVVLDSLTFLTDSMLFEIAEKEKRLGYKFTLEDYGRVAGLVKVLIGSILSCGIPLVVTAHCRDFIRKVDANSNPIDTIKQLSTYGMLRDHFPAMFDNVFNLGVEYYGSEQRRTIQLKADGGDNYSRTTLLGIEDKVFDVTLDFNRSTIKQGLYEVFGKFKPYMIANDDIEDI